MFSRYLFVSLSPLTIQIPNEENIQCVATPMEHSVYYLKHYPKIHQNIYKYYSLHQQGQRLGKIILTNFRQNSVNRGLIFDYIHQCISNYLSP